MTDEKNEELKTKLSLDLKEYLNRCPLNFTIERRHSFTKYLNSNRSIYFKKIFKHSHVNSIGQIEISSIHIWKIRESGKYRTYYVSSFEKLGSCSLSDRVISRCYKLDEHIMIYSSIKKLNKDKEMIKLSLKKILKLVEENIDNIVRNLNFSLSYKKIKNIITELSENKELPFPKMECNYYIQGI